jgi:mannan polymerase II complex ANP1 subunit
MAKRMHFSVVGLPHYTIWHLYEPSVDDIKHMEVRVFTLLFLMHIVGSSLNMLMTVSLQEMERERIAREKEEEERKKKEAQIKEEFGDANSQWEQDKQQMQDLKLQDRGGDKEAAAAGVNQGAAAKAAGAMEGQKN